MATGTIASPRPLFTMWVSVATLPISVPDGALFEPVPGLGGKRTPYQWIRPILTGSYGHLGEIEALKAMQRRARQRL